MRVTMEIMTLMTTKVALGNVLVKLQVWKHGRLECRIYFLNKSNVVLNLKNNEIILGLKLSAAALCVHMGSFSDPWDIQGVLLFY